MVFYLVEHARPDAPKISKIHVLNIPDFQTHIQLHILGQQPFTNFVLHLYIFILYNKHTHDDTNAVVLQKNPDHLETQHSLSPWLKILKESFVFW
jgi:hypothetical protein